MRGKNGRHGAATGSGDRVQAAGAVDVSVPSLQRSTQLRRESSVRCRRQSLFGPRFVAPEGEREMKQRRAPARPAQDELKLWTDDLRALFCRVDRKGARIPNMTSFESGICTPTRSDVPL